MSGITSFGSFSLDSFRSLKAIVHDYHSDFRAERDEATNAQYGVNDRENFGGGTGRGEVTKANRGHGRDAEVNRVENGPAFYVVVKKGATNHEDSDEEQQYSKLSITMQAANNRFE
nr:hypothetical protein [Marinobacter sp. F4206]